ncbi:MAG: phytanoyl-CoA dioxygenase family protein [Anaerolineae bacterium]|nr:phytanoyl-CoA dioxygenase family protein [Phycisphaerae bacterium]
MIGRRMAEQFLLFVDSTHAAGDPKILRDQLARDGYLFLRGVAPREKLLAVRRAILGIVAQAGWINPKDETWTGVGPFTEGDPEYMAVYKQILNLPEFKTYADDPKFLELTSELLDGESMAHRLRIGRVTFPNNASQTTAAHQDFQYIRGAPETYTIWSPIGDCPGELGGLAVLRGSHRAGFIEHKLFEGKKYAGHGLSDEVLPSGDGIDWHSCDFRAGDVLLFHSHTIHKARPNLTKDRLRLSTDNRYQRVGDAIAPVSQGTHYGL